VHGAAGAGEAGAQVGGDLFEFGGVARCEVDFGVALVEDCSQDEAVAGGRAGYDEDLSVLEHRSSLCTSASFEEDLPCRSGLRGWPLSGEARLKRKSRPC